ncbi:hypothetical protein [Streptomyces sp. SP18CS02]|uniref:hypothetical protein n=1 Tax=Streptomyces sp. SP18CS02 TaxID=3002531 RepID=UPI002E77D6A6|nr:hypothetical protein [Streptomyces sp. SP18CS02]MEE1756689.1 hypothetical protein [Streptomyces sp. SP18CS02]
MGSLRNPVGPLPSSIYWRRRAVAASLIALLALLTVWFVGFGDGDGKKGNDGANGASPAPSITPGPDGSGPAISEQPGGRDESGDTGTGGTGGTGGGSGADAGADGGKNGDTTTAGGTGGTGGTGGGAGSAQQVPVDSPLPNCAPGVLQLTLRSEKVSYAPGEKPRFRLVARNTSSTTCKADFGPRNAVLTISDDEDDDVWSSKDCPRGGAGGPLLLRVPAGGTVTHTVDWDRRRSAPQCATPPAAAVGAGTYLVEATVPGAKVMPASFALTKD